MAEFFACPTCGDHRFEAIHVEHYMLHMTCLQGHQYNVEAIDLSRLDRRALHLITKEMVVPKFSWTEHKVEGIAQIEWHDENGVVIATEDV